MTILHLSDTHGLHRQLANLPDADVIVHSGDFTMAGSTAETVDFINWFCDLPYRHKMFIAGNHDACLYGASLNGLDANCHYLCNSGICIDGVNFYGVPMFMEDAMNGKCDEHIKSIPDDTDVFVTHQPPFGILDFADGIHYGNKELMNKVEAVKLKAHLFGHIHNEYGVTQWHGTVFSNAALMNDGYALTNKPRMICV